VRKFILCLTGTLILACAACGAKNNLYSVSGKVTYRGSPAAGAAVFFYRKGVDPMDEHLMMAIVQENGTFELVCGSLGKGAPAGDYDILIEWKQASGQSKGRPQHRTDKLQGRYADRKNPRWHATIKAARNQLPLFELTD
jgi:hypothetical protein